MVAGGQARAAGRRMRSRPALAVLAVLIVTALCTAGCVSMPSGGPVGSFPVTQGPEAQSNPYVQIQPQSPGRGWSPQEIVQGFLTASASFGTYGEVALQYLTPHEQKVWSHPTWSAVVYKKGPDVAAPVYQTTAKTVQTGKTGKGTPTATPTPSSPTMASVSITGTIQATLQGNGSYSAPSASASAASGLSDVPPPFQLVKLGGQWRISSAPAEVLLTTDSFRNDYQLRNLYFFDPTSSYLVPDPIYVPLRAPTDLMNGLVQDLITPPADWLSNGATKTALPSGTKISEVTADGVIAVVNLTGPIAKASDQVMQQVSSQLLWTLAGAGQGGSAGQGVQSVEVELNGKPWYPPGSQDNPVQRQSTKQPATGASLVNYYYVDNLGYLTSRQGMLGKPSTLAFIGTEYSQVAVSPNGRYLAALDGSTLYIGLVGGALVKRGSGYQSMSWDVGNNLWASLGAQVTMFRITVTLRQPQGQVTPVPVAVITSNGVKNPDLPFSALRVAPDGVRVALIIGNTALTFGAISGQDGPDPQIRLSQVEQGPVGATEFTGLTWYGPDDVIALAQQPAPAATEYPVSGDTPTPIPAEPGMETITASSGNVLVAGLSNDHLVADESLTGAWLPLGTGSVPTYPG